MHACDLVWLRWKVAWGVKTVWGAHLSACLSLFLLYGGNRHMNFKKEELQICIRTSPISYHAALNNYQMIDPFKINECFLQIDRE